MFTEDLSLFFNTQGFGTTVTLDGTPVTGILSKDFITVDYVETSAQFFLYKLADKSSVAIDSILVDGLTTYKVKGLDPGGNTGLMKLKLEKQ